MAKKKETTSDFHGKAPGRNPNLSRRQINQRCARSGHTLEISTALYTQVRTKMGISPEGVWFEVTEALSNAGQTKFTGEVYQFKITLLESKLPIWRRIQVWDCSLDKLHEHIQAAMGWTNSHLHHFRIDGTLFGDPMLMDENFEEPDHQDSTTTHLSEILPRSGQRFRFVYEYDFGDCWQHEILFEGRPKGEPGKRYPLCLEGARACPPEDVGGVTGYADFLGAIADPKNEEHDALLDWAGENFDPESFSPTAATGRMKQGLPDWRKMR